MTLFNKVIIKINYDNKKNKNKLKRNKFSNVY